MSCCSCHITPPCSWCVECYECEKCGEIRHPSEYEEGPICRVCNEVPQIDLKITCECGARSLGVEKHSTWCKAYDPSET